MNLHSLRVAIPMATALSLLTTSIAEAALQGTRAPALLAGEPSPAPMVMAGLVLFAAVRRSKHDR